MIDLTRRWWQRIQWIDIVLVVLGVVFLVFITMELWLPHFWPE